MAPQSKQLFKYLQAPVSVGGFTSGGGASDNVTNALTAALQTAGDGGVQVPLQVGSRAGTMGIDTSVGKNYVGVYNNAGGGGQRYVDGNGNDVYGRIAYANNTWTLNYYSIVGGAETAFSMPANAALNLEFPYVFSWEALPYDAIRSTTERHVSPDLATFGFRMFMEMLTVTSTNTLSALSYAYKAGTPFVAFVNGLVYTNLGGSPPLSVNGTSVTWNSNAPDSKFSLATSDTVIMIYGY